MGLPEKREGRPRTGPADSQNFNPTSSIPAQIRRRRDAAQRSAPLADGRRDPLDPPARSFRPAGITYDQSTRTILVKGYGVRDVLRDEGMRPIYSVTGRGFLLDLYRLPDVVAALEWAGYRVTVRERAA